MGEPRSKAAEDDPWPNPGEAPPAGGGGSGPPPPPREAGREGDDSPGGEAPCQMHRFFDLDED